ncbi:hypothetical protein BDZ91DRAFT_790758 [Kalaharituber pfeilii]|nr:hypothetical protein BDZ91DRAFT_790758 [Kalaharituber pfeilii]
MPKQINTNSKVAIQKLKSIVKGHPTPGGEAYLTRKALEERIARGGMDVAMMWVKGHGGLEDNEKADRAAKIGALLPYQDEVITEVGKHTATLAGLLGGKGLRAWRFRVGKSGEPRMQVVRRRGGDSGAHLGRVQSLEGEVAWGPGGREGPSGGEGGRRRPTGKDPRMGRATVTTHSEAPRVETANAPEVTTHKKKRKGKSASAQDPYAFKYRLDEKEAEKIATAPPIRTPSTPCTDPTLPKSWITEPASGSIPTSQKTRCDDGSTASTVSHGYRYLELAERSLKGGLNNQMSREEPSIVLSVRVHICPCLYTSVPPSPPTEPVHPHFAS